jgi:toxin FitB
VSRFLLDTNIPSELTRSRPEPRLTAWLQATGDADLYVSVITLGEIHKGVTIVPDRSRRLQLQRWLDEELHPWFSGRILPVDEAVAERWGALDGQRQLQGAPLNTADGLIAATALEHDLTMVTRNVKDFAGLGVTILNPWEVA